MFLGDFNPGDVVHCMFTTIDATGAPTTLSGTPLVRAYKDASTTEDDSGITLTVDFDGRTGLNLVVVDTSADGTFFSAGSTFILILTAGTVDGVSVVGYVITHFSIEDRNIKANVTQFGGSAGTFASGRPEVNASHAAGTAWNSGAIGAATLAGDTITDLKIATGALTAAKLADGAIRAQTIASDAITSAKIADSAITAAKLATDAITAAKLSNDAISEIQSGLSTVTTAQVNAEVDAALADIHLDHLLATTYDPAAKPGAADALLNELVEDDAGVARYTANALEQAPSGGGGVADWTADERAAIRSILGIPASGTTPDDPTVGILDTIRDKVDVVDGVVDAILVDTAEIGAAGAGLTNINLPDQTMNVTGNITGNISGSVGSVTGAVGSVTGNVGGNVAGSVGSVAPGGIVAGSFAAGAIDAAAIAADAIGSSELAASAVTEIQAGLSTLDAAGVRTAVGLASANLDTQLGAIDDFLDTEIAAIKAVTDQLTAAQAEPSAVPAANATPLEKIAWLASLARNKITQTSTTQTLRNDADSGNIAQAAVSDDGTTFTRGEWA